MKTLNITKKNLILILTVYLVTAGLFYILAGDSLFFKQQTSSMIDAKYTCGEITQDMVIKQKINSSTDEINGFQLYGATYGRNNNDNLIIKVLDSDNVVLSETELAVNNLADNSIWQIDLNNKVKIEKGKTYYLVISSENGVSGNSVTFYYGDSVSAARGEVNVVTSNEEMLSINGQAIEGQLCCAIVGTSYFMTGPYYWYAVVFLGIMLVAYILHLQNCIKNNKKSILLDMYNSFTKYSFLIEQLVGKDFKTKYKRSVLGIFWSFLNPLLTMGVQFIVFSTLFKSSIENYPIYLLSGIVCYNFFNEVANMCLTSITGNESLIKKVYVPKYIYPVSRSLSSGINLLFSLIPLLGMMLITGTPIRPTFLLLIFGIVCLYMFSLGVGLILTSMMVFFRDTQFLWGVISMIWMYATPIIYPENIIPANILTILKLNPLYHIVRFFRTILIEGVSPEPKSYLICLVLSVVPLLIGSYIFKKTQDKFVLYL